MATAKSATNFQEDLWRGAFGDSYVDRNAVDLGKLAARTASWAEMLKTISGDPPASILEIGANIGLNLRAIRRLSDAALYAVEPNEKARQVLVTDRVTEPDNVFDAVATSLPLPDAAIDLVFTAGVLIHVHPDNLLASCREICRVARRYVLCIEYFADKPVEVQYRGHDSALFKRDFGSYYLDNFPALKLVDYGFFWSRTTSLDNLTWWVFEKRN